MLLEDIYMQQNSINKKSDSRSQGLSIAKAGKQKLSKNQEAFNKLTQRIERLQKEIEKKQLQFDLALKIYGTEVYPSKQLANLHRRELMIVLMAHYTSKKLAKNDQQNLKQVLREHLQIYLVNLDTEVDAEIKKIFNLLEGSDYDKQLEQEKEEVRKRMVADLKKMKVDVSEVDIDDLEAVQQKYYETQQRLFEEQVEKEQNNHQQKSEKKKSAKQQEAERIEQEVNQIKQKNIGTIYKQLAKLFHPDLEQDAERKLEKEILMKELTAAYEAKNLHALLSLELKWIHKENEHLENLTEEKLAVYLQILKEQAQELEFKRNEIYEQPQYRVLFKAFGWGIQRYPVQTVQNHLHELQQGVEYLKSDTVDFLSDYGLRYIKQMIKQWKLVREQDEDEEMLRM